MERAGPPPLVASDGGGVDIFGINFGFSVAISGAVAVVGAPSTKQAYVYDLTPTAKIEFLDPVPDLLQVLDRARAGTVDANILDTLAIMGRLVQGISADGVTQLLLRLRAGSSGERFRLSILDGSPILYGALGVLGSDLPRDSTIVVTARDTASGPMGFASYLAPADFPRLGSLDEGPSVLSVPSPFRSSLSIQV